MPVTASDFQFYHNAILSQQEQKIRPTQSKTEIGCRGTPNFVKAIIKCIERCKISAIKKAMTDNARHGEHQTSPRVSYLWAGAKKIRYHNDSGLGAGASSCWRRWRDLNSRYGFAVLPHFECGPFSHLGTSPCVNYTIIQVITKKVKPFVQI